MLYEIFFSPLSDAIAQTRTYTEPATSVIPPGSCGIPASKLWFALSQIPTEIVQSAIFDVLSSIKYAPEPTPEIEPVNPSKSKAVKRNLYGNAIEILAGAIVLGEPVPTGSSESNDPPLPGVPLTEDTPIEDLGDGGYWKASPGSHLGIGWKIYRTKSDACYHGKIAQLWASDWQVEKVADEWKLQVAYIDRLRWTNICKGSPKPSRKKAKPERLTEHQQSVKRQLELQPIGNLRKMYAEALADGFPRNATASTLNRSHLIQELLEAMEWSLNRVRVA